MRSSTFAASPAHRMTRHCRLIRLVAATKPRAFEQNHPTDLFAIFLRKGEPNRERS